MESKFGELSKLHLTAAEKDGKTIIEDVSFTAPFKVMRPFYIKKDVMTVMLQVASPGIMAGDRQEIAIHVKQGAQMEFVSQSYEKVHKMTEGHGERRTILAVEPDASLYYTPLPMIPFAESDYRSTADVELADETSRFVYREVLTSGRAAYGEEFRYDRFQNRVSVYQGGKIVYRDNTLYEPAQMDMRGFGMYEGFTHLGNLLICNEPKSDDWIRRARECIDGGDRMQGGVTRTAQGHIVVRILGMSGQTLLDRMDEILALKDEEIEAADA